MFQRTYSVLLSGLSGFITEIECYIGSGLPYFNIVGIPSGPAASSRERIRSALKSSGYPLPASRITINIHPARPTASWSADTFGSLDLPIALAILASQNQIPSSALSRTLFIGELSLNGALRPISGALSLAVCAAQSNSFTSLYLPAANAAEAALSGSTCLYALSSLRHAISFLKGQCAPSSISPAEPEPVLVSSTFDSILGQPAAKRTLMISAAGMHNLLMIGPPGCGKTMLARSLPSLLPPLTRSQQIELTEIYSYCQLLPAGQTLLQQRPFRAPHHTIPAASLIGGGSLPRPGEITLAHQGILYLDELPEFTRSALESLRQPLEDHCISLSRLRTSLIFPADFLLAASMNPCPCGYYPDLHRCHCSPGRVHQYLGKVDSPLLDRIDLIFRISPALLSSAPCELSYATAMQAIQKTHRLQQNRFQREAYFNSRMCLSEIQQFCSLTPALQSFMDAAYTRYHLTMRTYHKILKISRTLADLEESPSLEQNHLAEALQYRFNYEHFYN